MDQSLARNGEAAVIAPHVRWAEGREPYPTARQVMERFGLDYRGKHRLGQCRQHSDSGYVPRHAKPEDEWSS